MPACRTALVVACCAAITGAQAENWRFVPSAGITETYSNNLFFEPQGQESNGWVTSLTAALGINGQGARVKLNGSVAVTADLYASGSQNNALNPTANLFGSVEAIEKFFFIDASANVTQTFQNPFGPQPGSSVAVTNNRYTNQTYSVSPYIQGVLGATDIRYQVRNDNYWTIASPIGDGTTDLPNTYANNLLAFLEADRRPLGWRAEYTRYAYSPDIQVGSTQGNGKYTIQVARAIVTYQLDSTFQVSARGGYEDDQFLLTSSNGPVYGAGFQWNPSDRTQMGGFWEYRFFGSSFDWQLTHRRPNSAFSASFKRGLTTTPVSFAIPAGASVNQFLDAAFTTRIPDPVERAQAIEQFLVRTGLPPTLAAPVNYYGASILLTNAQNVSFALLGIRNALTFTLFNLKQQPIAGTGDELPPALQGGQNNNTQTGGGVSYSHQFTGLTNFVASATYSRTESNDPTQAQVRSNDTFASASLNTRFGPKTTGTAGISYSLYKPVGIVETQTTDAIELFVGVNHTF